MKYFFFLSAFFLLIYCSKQTEPWNNKQLIEPYELSNLINNGDKLPLIISIGPAAVIKNSIDIGETRFEENLNDLRQNLSSISKKSEIILFCGCCPFKNCPNIRPAFSLINKLGFINHKLLNLKNNLKTDWIDKDYPVQEID